MKETLRRHESRKEEKKKEGRKTEAVSIWGQVDLVGRQGRCGAGRPSLSRAVGEGPGQGEASCVAPTIQCDAEGGFVVGSVGRNPGPQPHPGAGRFPFGAERARQLAGTSPLLLGPDLDLSAHESEQEDKDKESVSARQSRLPTTVK